MFFDLFKRKKKNFPDNAVLSEEAVQWNKMWDLWANGEIASPYNELMTYQSEVNNGGHSQYFVNTENTSDISKEMSALDEILPEFLKENIKTAYHNHFCQGVNEYFFILPCIIKLLLSSLRKNR